MTWWSTSCRRLIEAKKIGASPDNQNGGIKTTHWFWGAAGRIQSAADKKQIANENEDDDLGDDKPEKELGSETSADKELNDLLLENPSMVAAALPQAMTAKGLKVVKTTEAFKRWFKERATEGGPGSGPRKGGTAGRTRNNSTSKKSDPPMGIVSAALKRYQDRMFAIHTKSKQEADSASTHAQVTREAKLQFKSTNLRESVGDDGVGPTRFKVVLLQEGLGNFGDAFYYHRDALESAVPVFTGSKIYADHPSTVDEEIRPERSVRDVLGHFENLQIETDKSERAMLTGEVCILPDKPFEWARGLMRHAIEHAKKFPDKDFIGLSINASGDADETPIDAVLKDAPASAKPKLVEAKNHGIESVKVVRQIKSAVSCDLVTEAGAGGKIINFIEGETTMGKKEAAEKEAKEKKEAAEKAATEKKEASEKEALEAVEGTDDEGEDAEAGGDDGEHDDAAADKELIKKMIAEYVGDGKDGGEMDEAESKEMESLAMEAYEAHKEMGASEQEAYERAGHALKLAKHMACKQSAATEKTEAEEKESKESKEREAMEAVEADDKDADDKDDEKKKESAKVAELEKQLLETKGKLAALSATVSKDAVSKYVDAKLAESKQPRLVTKQFREAAGEIRSKSDFDSKWAMFQEGLKNSRQELDWGILQEKAVSVDSESKATGGKGLDFSKLAED